MLLARFAGAVNSLAKMQAEPTRPISDSTRTTQQCIHKVVGQHALACKSLLCCLKYLCRRKQNAAASTGRQGQDGDKHGRGKGLAVYFVWLRFS